MDQIETTQDFAIEDDGPDEAERLQTAFRGVVGRLASEARKRVSERQPVEDRWLEDLRQYHNEYESITQGRLKATETSTRSRVKMNITRPRTNAMSARLMDLLFPTDDRNYAIRPTPVPQMDKDIEAKTRDLAGIDETLAVQQQQIGQADPEQAEAMRGQLAATAEQGDQLQQAIGWLTAVKTEARKRADLMMDEIDDQLVQSRYPAEARDMIEDACKVGTGILFGPITGEKARRTWAMDESGAMTPDYTESVTPEVKRIDYWSFFPDMRCRDVRDSEGVYLRHLMNAKALRKLAKVPGFSKRALRELLGSDSREQAPDYLTQLRDITGETGSVSDYSFYQVWQFIGPIDNDDLATVVRYMAEADDPSLVEDIEVEVDPLAEIQVVIWFCQGKVLKLALHPLDSGEPMFSVFNLEKDETSPFGYGVPRLMRDPQKIIDAAWRQTMDNAGIALGPQILIDKSTVTPLDGVWEIVPNKIWITEDHIPKESRPFETFNIETRQQELEAIINLARSFVDEMTAIPAISQGLQGEPGAMATQTAQGMALLMNSANVLFRRFVKAFDDDVTVPTIGRLYEFNMQFSQKAEIKGDFEVDARGSSVLLVREMQAQNLMSMLDKYVEHPVFGPMTRSREAYREVWKAHMLPASDFVLPDTEIDANEKAAAEQAAQAQQEDPAVVAAMRELDLKEKELDLKAAVANQENNARIQVGRMNLEAAYVNAQARGEVSQEQAAARLALIDKQIQSKERMMAAEIGVTARVGPSGGGYL